MVLRLFMCGVIPAFLFSMASAQTVTVAKTGSPTFSTISSAIASFNPDPDPSTPNIISITDTAVYDEVVTINVPLTIQGASPSSRPIICGQSNGLGATTGNDAININIPTSTTNTVVLKNIVVLPSRTVVPTDDGIASVGQNLYILMEDVLVTANNGSDSPVTIDGLTTPTLTGATFFGDDGIFVGPTTTPAGPGVEVDLKNVVVSATNYNAVGNDQLVCSGSGAKYTIHDGCVFSFGGRLGIQCGKDFTINAPNNRVFVGYNKGFAGIWFATSSANARLINGANIVYNNGFGIEHQNGGAAGLSLTNSIVANNTGTGLQISDVGITAPIIIDKVTMASQGGNATAINVVTTATATINISNSIIAGNGSSSAANVIRHNGTGAMTFNKSAVVLSGLNALQGASSTGFDGTGPVGGTYITANPQFVSSSDPLVSSFYDVANTAYGAAGVGDTPLGGGADYVGSAEIPNWTIY